MNKYSLYLSAEAELSLNEIIEHTRKQWGKTELQRLKKRLKELFTVMKNNPYAFKTDECNNQIRKAILLNAIAVYYKVNNNTIEVALFWNTRRDPDSLNL